MKPGSLLVYNLYASSTDPGRSDSRITLTNTNLVNPVSVHLFFIEGNTNLVTSQFITLTQNQTTSFLMNDIDPGVIGYVIAVATDKNGCPIIHNDLVGESYVRLESGHSANLPAQSIAGITVSTACTPGSMTTTLAFDGVQYNILPRTLALSSLFSPATDNRMMLIVNRLGGNLIEGAADLGTISGLLFNDRETSHSFTLTAETCQLRGLLGNNFPRTAPRLNTVIPAGRSGWMKFWTITDQAITGAAINDSPDGFRGGHNLHALTTTSTATLTIPVFPTR